MNQEYKSNDKRRAHTSISRNRATGVAMAHLPSPLRWIMLLGGQHGLSIKDIANLSGVSIKAIQSIQSRGFKLIETELQTLARQGLI
jgi:DNA-directed RNA polymerase specialized sigma24 family protein